MSPLGLLILTQTTERPFWVMNGRHEGKKKAVLDLDGCEKMCFIFFYYLAVKLFLLLKEA